MHLPALDGVRAIAILMVVVYHSLNGMAGVTWSQKLLLRVTNQGWLGVDLFFVLSGFLITGILIDARTSKHALRSFYTRRVLRIAPVYVVFLLFSLWLASIVGTMSGAEGEQLRRTQLWFWTYTVNLLIALRSWSATSSPTAHLWSLSVEEQFYLLWPAAVLLMSSVALRRTAIVCIIAAEICCLVLILSYAGGQVNVVMLPCRMDSLAAGALLASAYRDPLLWSRVMAARKWLLLAAIAALLAIVVYRNGFDNQRPLEQLIGFPAIAALGSVIIATAASGSAWLSSHPLRLVAKVSFGMYVWHIVAIRLMNKVVRLPHEATPHSLWIFYGVMSVGTVIGTVILGLISWYVIEQPFLRLKRFVPYS